MLSGQVLSDGFGGKLGLAGVAEVPGQMERLTCRERGREGDGGNRRERKEEEEEEILVLET